LTVSATTNRITTTGFSYDAAGNTTNDAYNAMTYDAASRLISAVNGSSSGAYAYDGNGIRLKKCVPNCSSPTTTTVYIYSGGKVIAEYDNGAAVGSPSRENIYSGSTQIAKIAGTTTTYFHQDHLSNRLVTNSSGGTVEQMGHLPFGEGWYDTGSEKWVFTTYERDAESGNDYAMARYNVSRLGRFSSPDPLSGSTANPQSLNRYAYVGNDPINATDPTGADMIAIEEGPDSCGDAHIYDPSCEVRKTFGCSIDYGCGGGGGGSGGGGGGSANGGGGVGIALTNTDEVDLNVLAQCTENLYGVSMTSYTQSQDGVNGSFVGYGADISKGEDYTQITITANVANTWAQINADAPSPPGYSTGAYTDLMNPYVNQLPSDPGITAYGHIAHQLVELGNSLAFIVGKYDVDYELANDPVGSELLQCVNSGGPGNALPFR
jgi:RHS repeat-associated protein